MNKRGNSIASAFTTIAGYSQKIHPDKKQILLDGHV